MQLGSDGDSGGEVNATESKAELATPVDTPVETPVDTPRAQQGAAAFRRKQQFLDKGHFYIAKNNYSGCKRYMEKNGYISVASCIYSVWVAYFEPGRRRGGDNYGDYVADPLLLNGEVGSSSANASLGHLGKGAGTARPRRPFALAF